MVIKKILGVLTGAIIASTPISLSANAASYTPQWGDCWSTVAEDYNLTLDELLNANYATIDTPLICGVPISIPENYSGAATITSNNKIYPQLGDGWCSIAVRTGYSMSDLKAANPGFSYPIYGIALNLPSTNYSYVSSPSIPTYTETYIGSHTLYNVPWGNSWYNIKLSASELNGMVVKAWNYFSFYEYFPHHCGAEGGYLWAGAYNSDGGAYGGGICFTSTTLYQMAVEVLGMQPWVRNSHVRPVDYAIWGVNDAAVNLDVDLANRQDMQFFNDLGYDVKFYTYTDDNTGALTISAYRVS